MSRRPRLAAEHRLWAWESHVYDWWKEGKSLSAIRRVLADDHSVRVGTEAIKAVLWTYGVRDFVTRRRP